MPPTAPRLFSRPQSSPAVGIQRAAAERGLQVGRDVSIICYDDGLSYLGNEGTNAIGGPAFTSTRSSIRAAGVRCAEILLSLIENPDQPPVHELWEPDLTVGRSTGPAPT